MNPLTFKRGIIAILVGVTVISSIVVAQGSVEVAGQIEISDDYEGPQKLTWDGETLWYSNVNTDTVHQVDPTSGEVINTLDTGYEDLSGIEASNDSLWVSDSPYDGDRYIYEINPETGEELSQIPAPGDSIGGVAHDGQNLWVISYNGSRTDIVKLNPENGNVLDSLETRAVSDTDGLAWGNGFLWATGSEKLLQIDPTTPSGEAVRELESTLFVPTGIAWDGEYLWETETANNTITRIDPGLVGQTNSPPNASFDYSPSNPSPGEQISFDGASSTDPHGVVEDYEWDFDGDGISDAQGETATYTFDSTGTYMANLTVIDEDGVEGYATKQIQVRNPTAVETTSIETTTRTTTTASPSTTISPRNTQASTSVATDTPVATPPDNSSTTMQSTTEETKSPTGSEESTTEDLIAETTTTNNASQQERGFLTNDGGTDILNFLENPLLVTILGFVASTVGILLQLLGGR